MGHSLGGITSFMYTCLYPKDVDFSICIDALKPGSNQPGKLIDKTQRNIEKFIYYDDLNLGNTKPPTYSYEECINKQYLGSRKSINSEYCSYILDRNISKCDKDSTKYYFTRDSRLKVGVLIGMQHEDIIEHARRVDSIPLMMLKATNSPYYEPKKNFYDVIKVLKEINPSFEYHYVEGTHHVHLNEPEKVAAFVNPFLAKYAYQERNQNNFLEEIRLKQ